MPGKVINMVFIMAFAPILAYPQIRSLNTNITGDYIGFGTEAGLTSFFGDIDDGPANGEIFKNNMAFVFGMSKNFNSIFDLKGQIMFGDISGEKQKSGGSTGYHLYFHTRFIEYSFNAGINLLGIFLKDVNKKFGFYAGIGLGLMDFRVKLYDGITSSVIKSYGYEGEKSTTELVIPFNFRFIYHVSMSSSLSLQTTVGRADTDKLDAVTGNDNRDYYNYTSVGYLYKINQGKKNKSVSDNSSRNKNRQSQGNSFFSKIFNSKKSKEKNN
jgi:hypothetical protein